MNIKALKNNKTLINGSLFSLFSFFNRGIAFVLLVLLANYITPGEYGKLSLFNTLVSFLMYFVSLSSHGYLSVSYFQKDKKYFSQDISSIAIITVICSIVLCIFTFLLRHFLSKFIDLPELYLWIAILIAFLHIFWEMLIDFFRVREMVGVYGILSCGFALLNFVLSLVLVISFRQSWQGRVNAQVISLLLFGGGAIIFFIVKQIFTVNVTKKSIIDVAKWGIPLIPHLAAVWIKQGGDRLIINHFYSIEDVGIFSFALNLMSIIIMLGQAFNATNSVSIYQILSSADTPEDKVLKLQKQTKLTFLIYVVGTILIIIGGCIGVELFLPRYRPSLVYFVILSLAGFFQCMYLLYCNYLFYYSKNKKIMHITISTAFIHLGLSLVLTRYSLIITSIIYVVVFFIIYVLVKKKAQEIINKNVKYGGAIIKVLKRAKTFYFTFRAQMATGTKSNIICNAKCYFGRNTSFGENCNFNGMRVRGEGKVVFGNNFHSGEDCLIISHNHNYEGEAIPYDNSYINKNVIIEDNVWVGDRVIILGGVTIGEGAIIQAGAVVVNSIPKLGIAGGSPARVFKERNRDHYYKLKEEKRFH